MGDNDVMQMGVPLVTLREIDGVAVAPPRRTTGCGTRGAVVLTTDGVRRVLPLMAGSLQAAASAVTDAIDEAGIAYADVWSYGLGGPYAYAIACEAPSRVRSVIVGGYGTGRGLAAMVDLTIRSAGRDPAAADMLEVVALAPWQPTLEGVAAPTVLYVGDCDPIAPLVAADGDVLSAPMMTLAGLGHAAAARSCDVAPLVRAHGSLPGESETADRGTGDRHTPPMHQFGTFGPRSSTACTSRNSQDP